MDTTYKRYAYKARNKMIVAMIMILMGRALTETIPYASITLGVAAIVTIYLSIADFIRYMRRTPCYDKKTLPKQTIILLKKARK